MTELQNKLQKLYGNRATGIGESAVSDGTDSVKPSAVEQLQKERRRTAAHSHAQSLVRASDAEIGLKIVSALLLEHFPSEIATITPHRRAPKNAPYNTDRFPLILGATIFFTEAFQAAVAIQRLNIAINAQQPPQQFFKGRERPLEIDPNTSNEFILAMVALYIMATAQVEHAWTKLIQNPSETPGGSIDPHALVDLSRIQDSACSMRLRHLSNVLPVDLMHIVQRQLLVALSSTQYALFREIQDNARKESKKAKKKKKKK